VNRSKDEQELHNQLISAMIRYCENNNYTDIHANLPGYPPPQRFGNHIPDLTAKRPNNDRIICEAETDDTLTTNHTREKLSIFIRFSATVILIVPESCESLAHQTLGDWGIANRITVFTMKDA